MFKPQVTIVWFKPVHGICNGAGLTFPPVNPSKRSLCAVSSASWETPLRTRSSTHFVA